MAASGLPVPPGFVIGSGAFRRFLREHQAQERITDRLAALDLRLLDEVDAASREIKTLIRSLPVPPEIAEAIATAVGALGEGATVPVAVRSSAIAEDAPAASFAGQQETYLNVTGADVTARVRDCWASFFGAHAIFYRSHKGSLADTGMAVVVQRMVTPDKSGVLFTANPVECLRDQMVVEAIWGFGEAVVSGRVVPDNYLVARQDRQVIRARIPPKSRMLVRGAPGSGLREQAIPAERARERVLSQDELEALVALGEQVETFFGSPQDIEWAIEGGRLYLLQSRPITTL